jgi:dTMP kinase
VKIYALWKYHQYSVFYLKTANRCPTLEEKVICTQSPASLIGTTQDETAKYHKGKLFVFEGPDDVGKTTLAGMLSDYLSNKGFSSQVLSFPGREPETVSELIYRLYHDPAALGVRTISSLAMQVMVTAAHIEVIETRVKPLVRSGTNVILDRFWWSTWVYATLQGVSQKARDLMINLELQSWEDLQPDLIFLIARREPLLPQPPNHRWPEIVKLYRELHDLQKSRAIIELLTNDGSLSETFDAVVSRV